MQKTIKADSVLKNIIHTYGNIALRFSVPLLVFPYISRVLGPENLGRINFIRSLLFFFVIFIDLGLPLYGVRELAAKKTIAEKREFLAIVFHLKIALFILVSLVYIFAFLNGSLFIEIDRFVYLAWILIFTAFLNNDWVLSGIEKTRYNLIGNGASKILYIVCIFLLVRHEGHAVVYFSIILASELFLALYNFYILNKFFGLFFLVKIRFQALLVLLKMLLWFFAAKMVLFVFEKVDILMLGYMRGDEVTGQYAAISRLLQIGKPLVGAVTIPMLAFVSRTKGEGKKNKEKLAFHFSFVLAMLGTLILFFHSKTLMNLFLGDKYTAFTSLSVLSFIFPLYALSNYLGVQSLIAQGRERTFSLLYLLVCTLNIAINFLLIPKYGVMGASLATLISELIIIFCFYLASDKKDNVIQNDIKIVMIFISFFIFVFILNYFYFFFLINNWLLNVCITSIIFLIMCLPLLRKVSKKEL